MCSQIFMDADTDPTVLSGAVYAPMGGAYRIGSEEHFIFEACEYMDSFLDFHPTIAILLGAELEHVDYFKDMEQITESFARFASLTGADGTTVVNLDDGDIMESARRALERGRTGRLVTFSAEGNPAADFTARHIRTEGGLPCFELVANGASWGEVYMAVPGKHQVINALAAAAAMDACGIPMEAILSGLAHYCGAGRRMEYKGTVNGARVYDDYGHHPTEVKATLEGAKALCCEAGDLICVFQPHTYSRTKTLFDQFVETFDEADRLLITDIMGAREVDPGDIKSEMLIAPIRARGVDAVLTPTFDDAEAYLRKHWQAGDVMISHGCGDIDLLNEQIALHGDSPRQD